MKYIENQSSLLDVQNKSMMIIKEKNEIFRKSILEVLREK